MLRGDSLTSVGSHSERPAVVAPTYRADHPSSLTTPTTVVTILIPAITTNHGQSPLYFGITIIINRPLVSAQQIECQNSISDRDHDVLRPTHFHVTNHFSFEIAFISQIRLHQVFSSVIMFVLGQTTATHTISSSCRLIRRVTTDYCDLSIISRAVWALDCGKPINYPMRSLIKCCPELSLVLIIVIDKLELTWPT